MSKSPRLTDLQLILLSHAAQQTEDSALPLPPAAADDRPRADKELKSLLRRGLLVEADVADATSSWRTDVSDQRIGLLLSGKGREAIGLADQGDTCSGSDDTPAPAPAAAARKPNKQDLVVELLRRPEGASLDQMMAATGWLAHSTRDIDPGRMPTVASDMSRSTSMPPPSPG